MKRIIIVRTEYTTHQTLGVMLVIQDHKLVYHCNTLELPWQNNERRISCVPPGTYRIVKEYSARFNTMLWELKDVPGRSECKIHTANYVHQLNGCIAPGKQYVDINGDGFLDITNSRTALTALHDALSELTETTITIYGQP